MRINSQELDRFFICPYYPAELKYFSDAGKWTVDSALCYGLLAGFAEAFRNNKKTLFQKETVVLFWSKVFWQGKKAPTNAESKLDFGPYIKIQKGIEYKAEKILNKIKIKEVLAVNLPVVWSGQYAIESTINVLRATKKGLDILVLSAGGTDITHFPSIITSIIEVKPATVTILDVNTMNLARKHIKKKQILQLGEMVQELAAIYAHNQKIPNWQKCKRCLFRGRCDATKEVK